MPLRTSLITATVVQSLRRKNKHNSTQHVHPNSPTYVPPHNSQGHLIIKMAWHNGAKGFHKAFEHTLTETLNARSIATQSQSLSAFWVQRYVRDKK